MASNVLDWRNAEAEEPKGQRNEMRMIARAADVLRALADQPNGRSLGQIAKTTGLARSTVQRIIGALEVEGLVSTQAGHSGAKLGIEFVRLAASAIADVRLQLRPHLERLATATGETVDLTRLTENGPVVVEQISSNQTLRVSSFVGRALPLHCTAAGKAHLMTLTAISAKTFLQKPLHAHTQQSMTSIKDVLALAKTQSPFAFAYEREEFHIGVSAIAVPLNVMQRENYALALSMPSQRFEDRLQVLRDTLRHCQDAIESEARQSNYTGTPGASCPVRSTYSV